MSTSEHSDWTRRFRVVAVIAVVAQLAWGALYIGRTSWIDAEGDRVFCLWDDSMIAMQYARNLARGEGLRWNPGEEPVQGFTNTGVTLVMAVVHLLPLGSETISLAFQILCLALLALLPVLVLRVARAAFPDSPLTAVGACAATVLCASVSSWTLQGSDVGFVAAWLLACLAALARAGGDGRWPRGFLALLAAGLLIRPDMALFYGVFVALSLWRAPSPIRRLIAASAAFAAVMGPIMLLAWWYYGDALPNTYYLKATGSPRALMLGSGLGQLEGSLPYLAAPALLACLALWTFRRRTLVVHCALLHATALAYNTWMGGDWAPQYGSRFVVPCLPLLLLLAVAGLARALELLPATGARVRGFALVALTLVIAIGSSPPSAVTDWFVPTDETMWRRVNIINHAYAQYFRQHADPSTTLGVHWAGVLPYFAERPAIDVLGKSDRHIAKMEVPRFFPGHSKWDWDYIMQVCKPDIMEIQTRGLGERENFRQAYDLVQAQGRLLFFIRKESLEKLHDPDILILDQMTHVTRRRTDSQDPGPAMRRSVSSSPRER